MDGVYSLAQNGGWQGKILEAIGRVRGHGSGEGEQTGEIVGPSHFYGFQRSGNERERQNQVISNTGLEPQGLI